MTVLYLTLGAFGAALCYATIGHVVYAVTTRWGVTASDNIEWRINPNERTWVVGVWPFIVCTLSIRRICLIFYAIGKVLYFLPLTIYRTPLWIARAFLGSVRRLKCIRLAKARVVKR